MKSSIYVPKRTIKKLAKELEQAGLIGKAKMLRAKMSTTTWEEEAEYEALLAQADKAANGIVKTEWEKKIIEKIGNPDGSATDDCWFSPSCQPELAKIEMEQDESRDWVDENTEFGLYTYMGEVCILSSEGYDSDFDSFPEDFQKKVWEIIDAGLFDFD